MINLTEEQFLAAKKKFLGKNPLTRTVHLGSLNLKGLKNDIPYIELGGKKLRVDRSFISSLASSLGITNRLQRTFVKTERVTRNGKVKNVRNEDLENKAALIEAIKKYTIQNGKNKEVILVADASSKTITEVHSASRACRLSNKSAFDLAEMLLDRHSNLNPYSINYTYTRGGQALIINLQADSERRLDIPGSVDDESFFFGMSIVSDPYRTYLTDYNTRLVCTNGMISGGSYEMAKNFKELGGKLLLNATDKNSIAEAFQWANALNVKGWVPPAFEDRVRKAAETKASIAEVEKYFDQCKNLIIEDNDDIKDAIALSMRDTWFPGIRMTADRLTKKGHNIKEFTDSQKSCISSNMTIWDLINSVTDLASNDHGYKMEKNDFLKKDAGAILSSKKFDLTNVDLYRL